MIRFFLSLFTAGFQMKNVYKMEIAVLFILRSWSEFPPHAHLLCPLPLSSTLIIQPYFSVWKPYCMYETTILDFYGCQGWSTNGTTKGIKDCLLGLNNKWDYISMCIKAPRAPLVLVLSFLFCWTHPLTITWIIRIISSVCLWIFM